jgi:hypothetical protein
MTLEAADHAALLREFLEAVEGGYGTATVFRAGVPSEGHGTGRR